MEIPIFILTFCAIFLIIVGILYQNESFIEWNIRWTNSLRGVQTKITKQSMVANKISGIVFIILGIFMLIMAFYIIPSTISSISNP